MPIKDMATSTSTFGFIRTIGGTVGISIGQAIFASTAAKKIAEIPNLTFNTSAGALSESVHELKHIPDPSQRAALIEAYTRSISTIWLVMTPLVGASFVMVLFIRKYSLDRTVIRNGDPEKPEVDPELGAVDADTKEDDYQPPTASVADDDTVREKRSLEKERSVEDAEKATTRPSSSSKTTGS
ncbi:hypothetical protein DXG03_000800 [Asterophora parasitica]|uniref:Uncharacterized protein n=1 Tax=Asterophora parasitica TaxID=117018 RepID=A0A9P7KFW1_9AGAR|nr:hypothetical protein DXG03_000800 [Asterophora parasitica]